MLPVAASPNVTDWITAIAAVFAAVGTVGAVIVALRQVLRQERRKVKVECRSAIIADVESLHVVSLRATNVGFRPVELTMAYPATDDGHTIVSPFAPHSASLPKTLSDGESVTIYWLVEKLDQAKDEGGFNYLYAYYTDTTGKTYADTYPGVKKRRKALRKRVVWQ
jgi:hypothetical protein